MEVMKGYKQTEVGVIPEDWEVKKLGEIADIDPDNLSNSTNPEYSFQYISLEDVDYGILRNTTEMLFKNAPSRARRKIRKDDILISTVRPTLKSHLWVKEEINNWICSTGFSVVRCKEYIAQSGFVYNHLFSSIIDKQIETLITGSNYPAINSKDVKSLQIPLPPTQAEQTAIAAALSDADTLISSLEKLIAKKRNIKQGAMQELLTGKKRLPGFSGKWEVKKFTEVCWFQEGPGVRNTQFTCTGVKLLNGTNIFKGKLLLENTDRFISKSEAFGPYSHFLADEGDIVIACSGITIDRFDEKISFVEKEHLPLCMNTSTMRFKTHEELLYPRYLYYYLMSRNFKKQIGAQATGSAQLNFGPSHVEKVEVILPKLLEQTAIAKTLSDMDAEIEQLEQKLDKFKMIKQGMMQELLTGKTRLV